MTTTVGPAARPREEVAAMTGQLRFALLGPVRAWRDTTALELGSPQQRATLAVLLLHEGRQVSADEVVDALWGGEPPRSATGVVRTYVSRLRRILDQRRGTESVIESAGDGYVLPLQGADLDTEQFQRLVLEAQNARRQGELDGSEVKLREALGLWRGLPLAGLRSPYFEAQRSRLVELQWAATEDLIAAEIELERHADVVAELRSLTARHPLRERLHELLMLALYKSGRQGEALAAFQDARRVLDDELGIDPGPSLQRMHRRILDVDPTLTAVERVVVPVEVVSAPTTTPNHLPPDLGDFVGRDQAIRQITDIVASPTAGVRAVGLTGMPGIGKTVAAVHAAHRLRESFPDGQLYVDLDGVSDHQADPHHVLGGFLRAFGLPEEVIPETLGDRQGLWRALTAERRVLVVLDNAGSADQVRRLMPSPGGSAAIITGRRRMVELAGVRWTVLGRLHGDEALTLLEHLIGTARVRREYELASRLVSQCAHHPLAIRVIAARLAARPLETIAVAEARLREEVRHLMALYPDCELVEAPVERVYRLLDARQAKVFRFAALSDAPDISLAAVAALVELPEQETHVVLESLVDVFLVEATTPGRYTFDPLLKLYAKRKSMFVDGASSCRTALASLLLFYLASTYNALRVIDPHTTPPITGGLGRGVTFDERVEACVWLLLEHEQVLEAIGAAGNILGAAVDVLGDLKWVVRRLEEHRHTHTEQPIMMSMAGNSACA
jgi:DNA-binding SARP family transcriptional activator